MKKEIEKKTEEIKFRLSKFDQKLIKIKAKESGLSVSEYVLNCSLNRTIKPPMNALELDVYKTLKNYQSNFTRLSNLIKQRDQNLYQEIRKLVLELGEEIKKIRHGQ